MGDRVEQVRFVARQSCIACHSKQLKTLDGGTYDDEPLRGFLEGDPWGESPLPHLNGRPWEYVQCRNCGQAFHRYVLAPSWQEVKFSQWMSENAIKEFESIAGLDSFRARYDRGLANVKHLLRLEHMTRDIRSLDSVRVLDFGCGWGDFLTVAQSMGFSACGIDRDPDRQRELLRRGIDTFPDVETASSTIVNGFHAITMFQVLEHLDEPLETLRSLHRVMVPGGILVIEVPNCVRVQGIRTRSDYYAIHPLEHINCFTPLSLENIANRAGFRALVAPASHATTELSQLLKTQLKQLVHPILARTTKRYFVRAGS